MNSPTDQTVIRGSAIELDRTVDRINIDRTGFLMRWLAYSLMFVLLSASCAAATTAPSNPALPMQEFIDQVRNPLATQIVDEWAEESRAEYAAKHPTSMQNSSSWWMMGGFIGAYVTVANQEAIQKYNAEIDARRQPVKKDLLALFTRRAKSVGDQYSVCVDGAERRYGIKGNEFIRLEDGPGPCEKPVISTKGGPENKDR